jgi:HPt (histidine-containing phosphotransfer) domain-containing protein
MRESAHSLKGASVSLRAAAAAEAAEQLEVAAASGQSTQISALAETLRSEIDWAIEYLQSKVA